MAKQLKSDSEQPTSGNRRAGLIWGAIAVLAFGAGLTVSQFGLYKLSSPTETDANPDDKLKKQADEIVGHDEKVWDGQGVPTMVPLDRVVINLKDPSFDRFVTIGIVFKVNLDADRFEEDEKKIAEFTKRVANIAPDVKHKLLEYFAKRTPKEIQEISIPILFADIATKVKIVIRGENPGEPHYKFWTKAETEKNKNKLKIIDSILCEEFTVQ